MLAALIAGGLAAGGCGHAPSTAGEHQLTRVTSLLAAAHPVAADDPYAWETVTTYPPADRAFLEQHVATALSRLKHLGEREIAAAINSYVYQDLRVGPTANNGVATLHSGTASCGGYEALMLEMLYLAGVRARGVFLLGVPYQRNHSLVEVYFADGTEGLYDPTFGVFFRDPASGAPVSLMSLRRSPQLAMTTLYKSVFPGGQGRAATPISSIAQGYRLRRRYRQVARPPLMDWERAFADADVAGTMYSGRETLIRAPLAPGQVYGELNWSPGQGRDPWTRLSHTGDTSFRTASRGWLFQLGQEDGLNEAHEYLLRRLRPGRRYRLIVRYAQGGGIADVRVHSEPRSRMAYLSRLSYHGTGPSRDLEVAFVAAATTDRVVLRLRGGGALVQAISLTGNERADAAAGADASGRAREDSNL